MTAPTHLPLPVPAGYHQPYTPDRPECKEDAKLLHTLAYCDLVETIAELLFPDNAVTSREHGRVFIKARDARVDRYILFRSIWDPAFGTAIQVGLMDFTETCEAHHNGKHFNLLAPNLQLAFLIGLSEGRLVPWPCARRSTDPVRDQKALFDIIYKAVTGGLFGEPGYGGNYRAIGWYYSNFLQP